MKTHIPKIKIFLFSIVMLLVSFMHFSFAQNSPPPQRPKPIILTEPKESLEDRLLRKITLDVRDMNIVDVIKFLAQKGEFNVVIAPSVEGKTTVFLSAVGIKDALDIVITSNRLAYHIENEIIHVMSSAEFEGMYGKQFSDKTEIEIIHLQYAKPSYILAALDNMKSNVGKIIIDEDTGSVVLVDTPKTLALMKKAISKMEVPLETVIFNLKYAKADIIAEKLRTRIDAKAVGSITADERSNQLIVRVFPGRKDEIQHIIQKLDEPTKEVLIEARLMTIVLKPTYDVGIDWSTAFETSTDEFRDISFNNLYLNEDGLSSSDELSDNNAFGKIAVTSLDSGEFSAAIRALKQVSDTKILANPQILVTENQEARIHIGDTIPYIISTTVGTADPVTSEDVRFIDVGLKLFVTPTINDDGIVTMRLRPEISSVVGRIDSERGGIPQINKTEVETTVMVKDGMTVVLAGLRKEDKIHTKKGLPVLMDIPYIEKLFSRTSDSITSSEVVILITPHIVTATDNVERQRGTIKPSKPYSGEM